MKKKVLRVGCFLLAFLIVFSIVFFSQPRINSSVSFLMSKALDKIGVSKKLSESVYDYDGFVYRMTEDPEPIPVGDDAVGYNDFIAQTFDTFLNDYPDEVTKSIIGASSTTDTITEEYNIYKFVFTPRNYEKTVFLSAGCHGDEYEGFWGLYRLMRMIYDEGYKYHSLRQLRHNIRFVIVPVWNPWGVENQVRNCPLGFSAGENLNRDVSIDGTTYTAFSSKECQAIRSIFDDYEGELSLWVDLHTDPYSATRTPPDKKGCYGYALKNSDINKVLYDLTVDFHNIIKDETGFITNITIYNSSYSKSKIVGYGNWRGVPTSVIETSVNEFSKSGTAQQMKYAQEWYGNVIASMINVSK